MKTIHTLDEIIHIFETREVINSLGERTMLQAEWRDALHYLKNWKDYQETMEALPDYYDLLDFWDKNHQNYGWASVIKSFFEGRE